MTSETSTRTDHRHHLLAKGAVAAIVLSVLLTIAIGLMGPSAMVPALDGPSWQPPYSLALHPAPHLVIALAAAAIVFGGLGLLGGLLAWHTTWSSTASSGTAPSRGETQAAGVSVSSLARVLVLVGCVAAGVLAFLPPSGSADHLNYAAYGRMVMLDVDPYAHGAVDLPGDPVADAVEVPWREEPSVYGPVATAVQALAAWIGGDSVRLTIFVLALVNSAAFILTALLLDRLTRDSPALRLRAALLWTANPLLLYQLVAGMHVDTLAIACMVAALLARGRPAGSGLLLGLGVAIKVNAGLVALGHAWELRRKPARLAVTAGVALAVVAVGYVLAGPNVFDQVSRASKSISFASFWKLVQGWFQSIIGSGAYRGEIQIGALLVIVLLAWGLFRLASRTAWAQRRPGKGDQVFDPEVGASGLGAPGVKVSGLGAPEVGAVVVVAYLFATPYILPWYDGLAFALLAMVAASGVDLFLAGHLIVLSLAYLPARVADQPEDLGWMLDVVRKQVAPWALLLLTAALWWWAWRAGGRGRTRPG
ncbi:polyprenol phosphomannose-dependent alpha 1,6 mannosyltransferase MptB [Nonomuraea sp. NPDC046570]|uniref:polyprenol phosphomannose-dependent alpha 1,6 mannosyltransferase MptB n=1 Tax=Nonomuraea sp. NPDC046570 TaxID=3155255 RepID=UPI0034022EAE